MLIASQLPTIVLSSFDGPRTSQASSQDPNSFPATKIHQERKVATHGLTDQARVHLGGGIENGTLQGGVVAPAGVPRALSAEKP